MELTEVPREFSSRYLNEGFSGGEKKRMEILQLALQQPEIGDPRRDRLRPRHRRAATSSPTASTPSPATDMGVLIITHYQRILHLVQPSPCTSCSRAGSSRRAARSSSTALEEQGLRLDHGRGRGRRAAWPDAARRSSTSTPPRSRRSSRSCAASDGGARLPRLGARRRRSRGRCIEAMDAYYRAAQREHPPRRLPARRGGDRALRGRARARRRASSAARRRETIFTRNATEAINLVAYSWGRAQRRRRRPIVLTPDGAPLEHRAVAAARARRSARRSPTSSSTDDGLLDLDALDALLERGAEAASRSRTSRTCSARSTRSPRSSRRAHAAGARRAGRRRAGRAAPAGRRRARSAPTSTPRPATRPTGRPASACCTGAASCSRRCRRSSAAAT